MSLDGSPQLTPVTSDSELDDIDESRVPTAAEKAEALQLKAKANAAFGAKDFGSSIELYTQALRLDPTEPTFWNNRAMSKAKMEEHGAAIADASKAIELKPDYAKAYYRRGVSALAILRPKQAVPDFKKALEIEPGNRTVREQLVATAKLIRRIEFEKVSAPRQRQWQLRASDGPATALRVHIGEAAAVETWGARVGGRLSRARRPVLVAGR